MSRNLPKFPDLDYLKKRAKILLRELQSRSRGAKLTQAQYAIAREYGFASWPKLKAYVESLPQPAPDPMPDPGPALGGLGGGGTIVGSLGPDDNTGGGGSGFFPRFTEKAKLTIFCARYFSLRDNKPIEAEHLFLGMVQAHEELLNRVFPGQFQARPVPGPEETARLKASVASRIPQFLQQMGRLTAGEKLSTASDSPLSSECRRVLEQAAKEADHLRHQKISTGHLLLAFLRDEVSLETPILRDVLNKNGIWLDVACDEIARFLSEGAV
jgi:ATP-dependent Clp protease ATP-binding subunit ClpC